MSAGFVHVKGTAPGRTAQTSIPVERFEAGFLALTEQMPDEYVWECRLVESIALRSESAAEAQQ